MHNFAYRQPILSCAPFLSPVLCHCTCMCIVWAVRLLSLFFIYFFYSKESDCQNLKVTMQRLEKIHTYCQEASALHITHTHTHCKYRQSAVRKWAVRYFALWLSQDRLAVIITLQVSVKDEQNPIWFYEETPEQYLVRERELNWSPEQTALLSSFCQCLFCLSHCSITSWDVAIWGKCISFFFKWLHFHVFKYCWLN